MQSLEEEMFKQIVIIRWTSAELALQRDWSGQVGQFETRPISKGRGRSENEGICRTYPIADDSYFKSSQIYIYLSICVCLHPIADDSCFSNLHKNIYIYEWEISREKAFYMRKWKNKTRASIWSFQPLIMPSSHINQSPAATVIWRM